MEYIIIGDTKDYSECLVCVCGSKEYAEEVLQRMLNNPNENDKALIEGHTNLRIKAVEEKDCWWNDSTN
jgi:hypothetical protein